MLITDRLVYIHMPKTGGTFVTDVLSRLHGVKSGGSERYGPMQNPEPKHGTCHDIPVAHRHKRILSSVRNPYDWYVSQYEFAWWKKTFEYHPEPYPTPAGSAIENALPRFQEAHPHFPEISFSEFVDLCLQASAVFSHNPDCKVGLYTKSLVAFYFRSPTEFLKTLDRRSVSNEGNRDPMFNIEFIRTHNLNRELYEFLVSMNYRPEDLDFLPDLPKIFPQGRGRNERQNWEGYYPGFPFWPWHGHSIHPRRPECHV